MRQRTAKANARIHRANREARASDPSAIGDSLPSPTDPSRSGGLPASAKELYVGSQIPKRHRENASKVDASACQPWTQVRDRVINRVREGYIIALLGNRGTGKSQIAEQLIRYATYRKPRLTAMYARAMTIILEIRKTYSDDGLAELDVVKRYCEPDVLVIDEFQERGETPFEDRMLTHIVDQRYGDMKDTLIIANLTNEAFKASAGPSIVDRLRETGEMIPCEWESWRGKKT